MRWTRRLSGVSRSLASTPPALGGFSLVELMVALAIAGILLFVALPGYQYAVLKSGRVAARASLLDVMARQEQFFVNNKRYAVSLDSLGLPTTYHVDSQGDAVQIASAAYRVELDLLEEAYAGVAAVPVNRQTGDSACMTFTLSRIGVRAVSGTRSADPAECW